jgi:hypothetical protein
LRKEREEFENKKKEVDDNWEVIESKKKELESYE